MQENLQSRGQKPTFLVAKKVTYVEQRRTFALPAGALGRRTDCWQQTATTTKKKSNSASRQHGLSLLLRAVQRTRVAHRTRTVMVLRFGENSTRRTDLTMSSKKWNEGECHLIDTRDLEQDQTTIHSPFGSADVPALRRHSRGARVDGARCILRDC